MSQSAFGPRSVEGFTRLDELDVERRPVFVRADLDAPVHEDGTLLDDAKIVAAVPTLRWLLEREAQVVVGAHRSLPEGSESTTVNEATATLEPCAARLAELLETEVYLPDRSTGLLARKLKNELRPGRLLVLENLLLDAREAAADTSLARELGEGIELYVGDCLAGPHHLSSLCALPRFVHERALGQRLEQELVAANRLRHGWAQGLVLMLGGRFSERSALLDHAVVQPGAQIIAMGDLAETLTRATHTRSDPNDHDAAELAQARSWLAKATARGLTLELAADAPAVARAAERLTRARCSLVLGAQRPTSKRDAALLEASVQGAGLVVLVHDLRYPQSELLQQSGRSRAVFVSTAGDAFEHLLCEQKLAGVEALRRSA